MSGRNIRPLIFQPFRVFPRVGQGVGQAVALHFDQHLKVRFLQQKSIENRSFRCYLELLGGFEPPTSSLPKSRGRFYGVPIHAEEEPPIPCAARDWRFFLC